MLCIRNVFNHNDTGRLKVKEWIKIYYANINKKKIGFGAKKSPVTEKNFI